MKDWTWVGTTHTPGTSEPEHNYFVYKFANGEEVFRCMTCKVAGGTYTECMGLCERRRAREMAKLGEYVELPEKGHLRDLADASDFSWPKFPVDTKVVTPRCPRNRGPCRTPLVPFPEEGEGAWKCPECKFFYKTGEWPKKRALFGDVGV